MKNFFQKAKNMPVFNKIIAKPFNAYKSVEKYCINVTEKIFEALKAFDKCLLKNTWSHSRIPGVVSLVFSGGFFWPATAFAIYLTHNFESASGVEGVFKITVCGLSAIMFTITGVYNLRKVNLVRKQERQEIIDSVKTKDIDLKDFYKNLGWRTEKRFNDLMRKQIVPNLK